MKLSTQALSALPPKQALALALLEWNRRQDSYKAERESAEALARAQATARLSTSDDEGAAPTIKHGYSLVLDPNHPLYDLLHTYRKPDGTRVRYKVYWGGRGSAKSWGIAEAIIRKCQGSAVRVLCVREFQNSMKDSSHKLLHDTIKRLGLESWFNVTREEITSRAGALILFKGMHGNEQGIRSTEGIDITWVEEAQVVSAYSWRSLAPTVLRKDDSEIWVSYNLVNENDATHQRFVITDLESGDYGKAKRRGSIVHKINYDSNPFFAGSPLEAEMQEDKESDQDVYEHVWLGMPQKRSNAIIFNGKYRVETFDEVELERECLARGGRVYMGADFGFADDPSTLVKNFILDKTLYVPWAVFGEHVELDDMPAFYDQVPGARDWPIKGDAARPETISHITRRGFAISAAEKWEGCVEDGITHLRSYDSIVIHSRNKELAEEAYMYRFKVDPKQVDAKGQPVVLPIIVDKWNHGFDALRYSHDGLIQRSGEVGMWARLGRMN